MRPTLPATGMPVAVINIPAGAGRDNWEACFRLAADQAGDGAFGINESLTVRQRNLYDRLADQLRLGTYGLRGSPNPVFWAKARWELVHGTRHRLHPRGQGALARRWPGYNAPREATVVVLADRLIEDETTIICTHWAPQGPKVIAAWRRWSHRVARQKILRIIRRQLRAGRVVWLIGDFNEHGWIDLASRIDPELGTFTWVRGRGVDKVGVAVPRGVVLEEAKTSTFPAPTDHKHGVRGWAAWRRR